MQEKQRGNVLFLILIAVALFAALSYAVTRSTRGGGNADKESSAINVAQKMQYAASVKVAFDRLNIMGCDTNEISFDWTPGTGSEKNANAPSDLSCHIFSSNGGGVAAPQSSEQVDVYAGANGWTEVDRYAFPGHGASDDVTTAGGTCIGCEVFFVYHGATDAECLEVNEEFVGISSFPPMFYVLYNNYDGDFSTSGGYWLETEAGGVVGAAETFCVKEYNSNNQNVIFHTIWSR